ncbi:Proteophosphoglycan ppg4 [Rhodotorula diobovata]|uniref:Proteophosphoglycan ppg4 n=1 Tax=Rhodotorula diobovata TaxID=5288 RepID=A0A5C5G1V8_9BASI|nr:Proteophosphoglycan ppg4 [Rhodotorula diobovata]
MIWSGNTGNVTRTEIETALGMLRELEPLWENGQGNVLADGWLGQGMHDACLLYEVTGDRRALDVIVNIADNILALQNANTPDPVTIWTGAKDSVWPTADLDPEDGKLVYAGCEQGLIAGNMAAAAVFILKVPCLYDMVPPRFAGPTIFNASTTYFERAKAYIAAADDTYQSFFWRFVDSNLNLINPADERWWLTGDTRAPGTPMPWNRGMMMMHGYLRLAAAHETEAAFDADLTAYYDAISRSHISNFVKDLNQSKAIQNGVTTFSWDYSYGEDHTEESQGVHAYYDVWGSWIGWQRNSAVFGLSDFIGRTFAQTFENTISFGNGSFAGLVTGSSSTKAYTINSLFGGWSFYALWLPEWFDTIATANVEASFRGRTWLAIPLLWTKHALAMNDVTFWSSRFSSGFGVIVGTEEGGGSASSPWRTGSNSGAASAGVGAATFCTLVAAVLGAFVASTWT